MDASRRTGGAGARRATPAWALALLLALPPAVAQQQPGASPQAWAAAAALSRGIAVQHWPTQPAGESAQADAGLVSAVAGAGFRSVQLPWPAAAGAAPDEAALRRLDRLVDAFLARGLAVVLHDTDAAAAACGGSAASSAPVAVSAPPAPLAAAAWQGLARRHAGRSTRLMFMLSVASLAAADAEQANRQLWRRLRAIRAADPQRPVIVAWGDAINLPRLRLPPDPRLLVAVVNREPERFTHQGRPGIGEPAAAHCCDPRESHLMGLPLDLAQAWSERHRVPVWLSGFGTVASAPAPARARHARLMRDAAEARGLAWAYCALDGDFGLRGGNPAAQAALQQALLGP